MKPIYDKEQKKPFETRLIKISLWVFVLIFTLVSCRVSGVYVRDGASEQASEQASTRLILIGDAGLASSKDALWPIVQKEVSRNPEITKVVFLGDNVYESGLPHPSENNPDYEKYATILRTQVLAAKGARAIYFVPGNHDWANRNETGKKRVLAQSDLLSKTGATLLPKGGCPDLYWEAIDKRTSMLFLDSQAITDLLADKNKDYQNCQNKTKEQLEKNFHETLLPLKNKGHRLLIMAHHPLKSISSHGGYFGWEDHVFPYYRENKYIPVPIVASLLVWSRQWGLITSTDVSHRDYKRYIKLLNKNLNGFSQVFIAAGHDHNLQLIEPKEEKDNQYHIISGSGSKQDSVFKEDETIFASPLHGFMIMDITEKKINLEMITNDDKRYKKTFKTP